jgi:RNA polymerase sigma-70 factor (ECF subfamily)
MKMLPGDSMAVDTLPNPTEPDLMLLHRFIETGDPATFAEIVQRYGRVVYAASLRVLNDEGRAQDVSQETFFRLMQRPRVVTHSLAGWLHRTATHLALDVRRGEISRKNREQTYGLEQQQNRTAIPTWAEISPFVDQALNAIAEPTRGLLIRHFLQGVQQTELAAELGVSPATLSRRIKSGLEMLQENLRKKGVSLSVAALAGFCASSSTHAAVPAAFVNEMAKMKLVGSLKHLPWHIPVPVKPAPHGIPQSFCPRPQPSHFVAAKFGWALVSLTIVLAVYTFAMTYSWMSAAPLSPPPNSHLEPTRVIHDR